MTRFFALLIVLAVLLAASCSSDPRTEAARLAADPIPCKQDSDCCVVDDDCQTTAYVVASKDANKVTSLIASAEHSNCTRCMTPMIQASCGPSGTCVGQRIDQACASPIQSGFSYPGNHCGKLDVPASCAPSTLPDGGEGDGAAGAKNAGAETIEGGTAKTPAIFTCGG